MKIVSACAIAAFVFCATAPVSAQEKTLKIGVLNDQSGLYADMGGLGSIAAAKLAVEDSGLLAKGWKIDVLGADHQNKPDVASNIARRWFDIDGVDVVTDVTNSAVALAIAQLAREKNKVELVSGAATSELTGKACSPNTIHWTHDTWALANGTGKAIVQTGGDTWFFLTADYAFGHALERDTEAVVLKSGGKVLGKVLTPLNTADFSSFLLQAQSSGAKIVGLANSGVDTSNSLKQAAEFGIVESGQKLAGLLVYITDVHAAGLPIAQGLILESAFYWDLNDGTRAFSERFSKAMDGRKPTMVQAGVYSSVIHYLKAVEALGNSKDGAAVVAEMKSMPTEDIAMGEGTIRIDGRKIHDMYLLEVKKPSESKGPWDYYTLRTTIPAAEAFRPLDQGGCSLAVN
ncbi:amino acid/amide ABC transporter substrate-binding protein (HAAT family) [Ancylobacter aquaticus]|uniref:Amino acid/amide ABC transporter substrate-binding protein (HAAT family) n=1 Tax=Ancylobacter aquaticus TaxID=100 RepID=A0A4R1I9Y3_ANCAQ|nr:ABC transporter substrate-binding protein [Ancylobacter aquaticus]TCK30390.1 amino acid/amide ABC transporter substrate-binding protein (HAAT family) [Ancylobacter aquaticus]